MLFMVGGICLAAFDFGLLTRSAYWFLSTTLAGCLAGAIVGTTYGAVLARPERNRWIRTFGVAYIGGTLACAVHLAVDRESLGQFRTTTSELIVIALVWWSFMICPAAFCACVSELVGMTLPLLDVKDAPDPAVSNVDVKDIGP